MELREVIGLLEAVVTDAFFVVDADRRIVHHNAPFRDVVPRSTGRRLVGRTYDEIVHLELPDDGGCIVSRCWASGRHLRVDEVRAHISGSRKRLTTIVTAMPFFDEQRQPSGALVVVRDVSHEAQLQQRYRRMVDQARAQREHLEEIVRARTVALLEANARLIETRGELMELQRELF